MRERTNGGFSNYPHLTVVAHVLSTARSVEWAKNKQWRETASLALICTEKKLSPHFQTNWCHHCQAKKNDKVKLLFMPSWLTFLVIVFIWLFGSVDTWANLSPHHLLSTNLRLWLLNKKTDKRRCRGGDWNREPRNMCQYFSRVDIITTN